MNPFNLIAQHARKAPAGLSRLFSIFPEIFQRFRMCPWALGIGLILFFLMNWPNPAFSLAAPPSPLAPLTLAPLVTKNLEQPVFLTHAGGLSSDLFIIEQAGRIRIMRQGKLLPTPFLDITNRVNFGGERGLLGLAFHPMFHDNGRIFVHYSRSGDGATVISEFHMATESHPARTTERILLTIPQPYSNHNGGMIAFGSDGFLYIATGDGGAGGDPENRGQNSQTLLGKILRIDVDHGEPYSIPRDNPFVGQAHGKEIFALGFRNPWRFSFDRATGVLWVADVGQNRWEEINRVEKGKNYGWRIMEGTHCFHPSKNCPQQGLVLPVAEYGHQSGRCSITGGYVYRGHKIPALTGTYLFGDYCSGEIMGLVNNQVTVLLSTGLNISSFGEDAEGELYVVDHRGGIYQILPGPAAK